MKINVFIVPIATTFILTACAGGGASEPKVPVAIPTAQPIANVKLSDESNAVKTINTLSDKGITPTITIIQSRGNAFIR